jgi:hypothetical protein
MQAWDIFNLLYCVVEQFISFPSFAGVALCTPRRDVERRCFITTNCGLYIEMLTMRNYLDKRCEILSKDILRRRSILGIMTRRNFSLPSANYVILAISCDNDVRARLACMITIMFAYMNNVSRENLMHDYSDNARLTVVGTIKLFPRGTHFIQSLLGYQFRAKLLLLQGKFFFVWKILKIVNLKHLNSI